jgi:hypothetical protein
MVTSQRNNVKASLHWQSLLAKPSATATHDSHESDRMISILCHAAQGSQGKYTSDCRRVAVAGIITLKTSPM